MDKIPIILSIETATDICSVSLSKGDKIVSHKTLEQGKRHSSMLTSVIQDVIMKTQIDMNVISAVAVSDGPGSYTGLRVGASTAKGICYALDIPLIAVSSLEALSKGVDESNSYVLSTIDARRMEVYAAIFHNGALIKDVHSIIWSEDVAQQLSQDYGSMVICGTGIEKASHFFQPYSDILLDPNHCDATSIASIAWQKYEQADFVDIAYHDPFYFKPPNITTSKKNILG